MLSRYTALLCASLLLGQNHATWRDYGGHSDAARYSTLRQINRTNVNKLEAAWSYSTADNNKYFFNPIAIDGILYVLAKHNSIVALDAATGKEIWTHESGPGTKNITKRGINYWENSDKSDRRALLSSEHFLHAANRSRCRPMKS